jgi:hypothetical protein
VAIGATIGKHAIKDQLADMSVKLASSVYVMFQVFFPILEYRCDSRFGKLGFPACISFSTVSDRSGVSSLTLKLCPFRFAQVYQALLVQ